jgi:hypothetical protein
MDQGDGTGERVDQTQPPTSKNAPEGIVTDPADSKHGTDHQSLPQSIEQGKEQGNPRNLPGVPGSKSRKRAFERLPEEIIIQLVPSYSKPLARR